MPKKLLIMGDSNSVGLWNALTGLIPNGPTLPWGLVRDNWTVVNEARGGEDSVAALARIATVVAGGPYDVALVCYGGIDFLIEIAGAPPPGYVGIQAVPNMLAIEAALKAGGTPKVYLAEGVGNWVHYAGDPLYPPTSPEETAGNRAHRAGYHAIGHCLRNGWGHKLNYAMPQDDRLINPNDGFRGLHLTGAGYDVLARRVLDFLRADGVGI